MTSDTQNDTAEQPEEQTLFAQRRSEQAQAFRTPSFLGSPAVKFVIIGILTVMLLVPSLFVWVLVEERAERARDVAHDIARSWGGIQKINGPYLVVPFSETYTVSTGDSAKTEIRWHTAILFPEKLDVRGDISVQERRKSIYSLPVYHGSVGLKGRFAPTSPESFEPQFGGQIDIAADKAVLVVGVGDIGALKSEVDLVLNGQGSVPFEPGLGPLTVEPMGRSVAGLSPSGINAPVAAGLWRSGFSFDIPLEMNGSRAFYVAPAGQTTSVSVQSDWPHPGFTGAFLPETREIGDRGFTASWTIPYLARGIPRLVLGTQMPLQDKALGVEFVEPVNFYHTIARSLKYAVCFISLTFLAVFILEMRSRWRVHWIQYGLVGLSLIVFYVMLLALAEHVGYGPAYLLAAAAATLLNTIYIGTALKSRLAGGVILTVLAAIFGVLYALMQEQDYALLIGSLLAFLSLAITMFATQRIDWSGKQQTGTREQADPV
ncbi:cell envelope integrity protein CreD [Roseibium sp. FZY0029]|uniref:cell envelope integrity protein CreD n=1 Tax=Roseibium sp. FZY0029 TaxID=3116647 RepID=UPI002EAB0FF0|nr:cell envelope integrity protein CreD [Roseibium sp. FZY0029]